MPRSQMQISVTCSEVCTAYGVVIFSLLFTSLAAKTIGISKLSSYSNKYMVFLCEHGRDAWIHTTTLIMLTDILFRNFIFSI